MWAQVKLSLLQERKSRVIVTGYSAVSVNEV